MLKGDSWKDGKRRSKVTNIAIISSKILDKSIKILYPSNMNYMNCMLINVIQ